MSSFLEITLEEQEVIDQLKKRIKNDVTPKMVEDETLFYRFAKARDFNIEEAESMLRKHIAWRKELKIDTFLTDYKPPEVLQKYFPSSVLGYDKKGNMVRYQDFGRHEIKYLWYAAKKIDVFKTSILLEEQLIEQCRQKNGSWKKCVYIFDFEGLTFASATDKNLIEVMLKVFSNYFDNYPERMKVAVVINAPIYFNVLFSLLKPILPPVVRQKIRCYGNNGWKETLLELIDADELPAFLGGNKTDPDGDPSCKSFIRYSEHVPECYYFCNLKKILTCDPNAEKLTIARSSKEELCFDIEKEGSGIEWEFQNKSKDIGFAVYFKENASQDPVELIPYGRTDTCYGPEKGFLKCKKIGIYTILFDNSYSWMSPKEVYYKIKIKTSKDCENHS